MLVDIRVGSKATSCPTDRMSASASTAADILAALAWTALCRVEMWRGGCWSNIAVAASFVWRCLSASAVAPFPHPAHRTGHAGLPHPALGQDFTPLLLRATPSAVSEHSRS